MKRAVLILGVIMATFTMFGARITTSGDERGAREKYMGEANRMLYQLRMLNKTGFYALKDRKFMDGTVMSSFAADGKDYVNIYKPLPPGVEEAKIEKAFEMLFAFGKNTTNAVMQRLDPKSGDVKWEQNIGVSTTIPMFVSASKDFVVGITSNNTTHDMLVDMRKAKAGAAVWQKTFHDGAEESGQVVRIDDKAVFVLSDVFNSGWSSRLRMLDLDGNEIWKIAPPAGSYFYGLGINKDYAFVGGYTSTDVWFVNAYHRVDGSLAWTENSSAYRYNYPSVVDAVDNRVYISGQVYNGDEPNYTFWQTECRVASTGTRLWSNAEIKSYYKAPFSISADKSQVYVTGSDFEPFFDHFWTGFEYPRVEARNADTGDLEWTYGRDPNYPRGIIHHDSAPGIKSLFVCGYTVDKDYHSVAFVEAVNKSDKNQKWRKEPSGFTYVKSVATVIVKE